MPSEKAEPVAAAVTIYGSILAWFLSALDWMSQNLSLLSALTLLGGFVIQYISSRRNREKLESDERRAEEEHRLRMRILLGEARKEGVLVGGDDA